MSWTMERHTQVKARCSAATPGPWTWDEPEMFLWGPGGEMVMDQKPHQNMGMSIRGYGGGLPQSDNADFVANARMDLPDALLEIERLVDRNYRDATHEEIRLARRLAIVQAERDELLAKAAPPS